MESRKAGYSEITRLRVKIPSHNPALPPNIANKEYFEVTENRIINSELHSTFRDIYKLKPTLDLTDTALTDYMNSDGDTAPLEELEKRKLTATLSRSMEGLLTIKELTYAVMVTMKGDSSPGCDGFTVIYLQEFWYDLNTSLKTPSIQALGTHYQSHSASPS